MIEHLAQLDLSTMAASLKAAAGIAARFEDLPLKSALLDVNVQAMDLVSKAMALQSELATAWTRIAELEAELAKAAGSTRDGLTVDRGVYWASESREHGAAGPFCPTCLDTTGKRVLMQERNDGSAYCAGCAKVRIFRVWPEKAAAYHEAQARAMMPRRGSWLNP